MSCLYSKKAFVMKEVHVNILSFGVSLFAVNLLSLLLSEPVSDSVLDGGA